MLYHRPLSSVRLRLRSPFYSIIEKYGLSANSRPHICSVDHQRVSTSCMTPYKTLKKSSLDETLNELSKHDGVQIDDDKLKASQTIARQLVHAQSIKASEMNTCDDEWSYANLWARVFCHSRLQRSVGGSSAQPLPVAASRSDRSRSGQLSSRRRRPACSRRRTPVRR